MSAHEEPTYESLGEAVEAFQRVSVPTRPRDADLLARINAELDDKAHPAAMPCTPKRRAYLRFLVPSAAAAVLVIAGIGWLLLHGGASVALADVVKAAAKHKLVRYRQQQISDRSTQIGTSVESTVYADFTAPRLYSESHIVDSKGESILLSIHDGKHHLTTNSSLKSAKLDRAPSGYKSVLCCLEDFEKKQGVTQERCDLDGRTAVKYCHVDGKQATTLWVDAKRKLPLRMEQEFLDSSPGITRNALVWTDFAWDPELPPGFRSWDDLFSTRPPEGYTLDDQTKRGKQRP